MLCSQHCFAHFKRACSGVFPITQAEVEAERSRLTERCRTLVCHFTGRRDGNTWVEP